MEEQKLKYWLAWNKVREIGPVRFSYLLTAFSSLEEAWLNQTGSKYIMEKLHIGENTWQKIEQEKKRINPDDELALLKKMKINVITIKEEGYPAMLKNIYDPPPILYYQGDFINLMNQKKGIAIVGSRRATYYGRKVARDIAAELSLRGYIIISGLARGIDTHAHMGSLEAGGFTIAVLGCGMDRIYPSENRLLAESIIKKGALISEFPIHSKPEKSNFPRRNRIISGLTIGTLVVEASEKSGALITADFALDQGREVFAVPGSIYSFFSTGCHNLIKQGAKLVNRAGDILEEFESQDGNHINSDEPERGYLCKETPDNLTDDEKNFLEYISIEPLHIDEIAHLTACSHSRVSEILLSLELKNQIREIEGKRYIRI